jgi:protoporphyrinogen oxidase
VISQPKWFDNGNIALNPLKVLINENRLKEIKKNREGNDFYFKKERNYPFPPGGIFGVSFGLTSHNVAYIDI